MQNFTKYLIISFLVAILGLVYYTSTRGYGLKNFTDAQIRAEAEKERANGSRAGRSYFVRRSIRGGGFRFGK